MSRMHNTLSTGIQSKVFANGKGEPHKFFVEATAVRERPTLIRKIIKNSGLVVNSAREADILLAESNTKEALELFDAWCGDKIVLSTRWIPRCLEEQTFLGSDREWGGYEFTLEALRQGIANVGENSEDEEEEEVEKPKRARGTVTSSQASSSKQSWSEPGPSLLPPKNTSLNKSRRLTSSRSERTIQQNYPNATASPSQSHFIGSPHTPRSSQLPVDTSFPTSTASSQLTLQQQQALIASMVSTMLQTPQQPPSTDLSSPMGQYPNFAQFPQLLAPPLQQLIAKQLAVTSSAQSPQPQIAGQSILGGTGQQLVDLNIPGTSRQPSAARPTPVDVDTDPVSDDASIRSEEREVELSISRGRGAKKRKSSDVSSDRGIQTAIRSTALHSKEKIPKKTGIFVNKNGDSKTFYVMVDLKNRQDLLKIIRKHNGTIVSEMDKAHYIILNTRSKQFQTALNILPKDKLALSPTWVETCERENKLVDIASHVINVSSGVRGGAAKRKPPPKVRRSVPEEPESEEGQPEQSGKPVTKKKASRNVRSQAEPVAIARSQSQSPVPPNRIEPHAQDSDIFTAEDGRWFFAYARYALGRNPQMGYDDLMREIERKTRRSIASWENAWRTMWPEEMRVFATETVALKEQRKLTISDSDPFSIHDTRTDLVYPDASTTPTPAMSQSTVDPPPSSASTARTSQAPSVCMSPLKRRENPNEDQVDTVTLDQPNKRIKTQDES